MGKKVTAIPATISRFTAAPITAQKKRKVAGYARVSTDHDDQFTSYEAQIDYYTNYIKSREDWEFIKVYAIDNDICQFIFNIIQTVLIIIPLKAFQQFVCLNRNGLSKIRRCMELIPISICCKA